MEVEWKQSPRQVLFPDADRAEATGKRNGKLGPDRDGDLRHCKARGGVNMSFEQWYKTLALQWRDRFRGKEVDQELSDELRDHLEQQIQVNLEKGMSPEAARYAALLALGGITQIEQQCRDARGQNFIENTIQDLRYGFRQLGR